MIGLCKVDLGDCSILINFKRVEFDKALSAEEDFVGFEEAKIDFAGICWDSTGYIYHTNKDIEYIWIFEHFLWILFVIDCVFECIVVEFRVAVEGDDGGA